MKAEFFKTSIDSFKDKLFRMAYSIVRDKDEANDVIQDSLIKIWESSKKTEIDNLEAWSMRITKNTALDKIRSNKYAKTNSIDDKIREIETKGSSPYASMERSDTVSIINKLIDDLPEKQKIAIQLRDIEGYKYEEISAIMELKLSDVKVSVFRGRKSIREQLLNIESFGA